MAIRASHIFPSLLFACATVAAHAAELGEAQVLSHIGQPLAASVELTMIEDGAAKVGVRLAHPDVYRGANIAMPAVLSSLGMHVTRQGGRQVLHLSTGKPVESRHLHVYLELLDGGQRSVRLVTLWLTPDPNPAPAPSPVHVSPPAPVASALPASPAVLRPVAPAARPVPASRPAAALHEGEEYVEPRKPVAKSAAAPKRKTIDRKAAPAAAPPAAPVEARETPGTCAPQPAAEQLNACAVLGQKNATLRHELGQLEAKVKVLQVAAAGAPNSAPAAAPAPAPAPKGAPRIQLKPTKPAPPEPETPWGLIAGAVAAGLALAGLAAALLRRRKRSTFGKIPQEHKPARLPKAGEAPEGRPKPSFMSAVKARLMPGSRKNPAPEPVEPAVENSET